VGSEDVIDAHEDPEESEVAEAQWHCVLAIFHCKSYNTPCMFCDKFFSVCSTAKAAAHIFARPVWAKTKQKYMPVLQSTKRMMTGVQL
jgi:hypothetical protein